jgi:threonine/homoserine/homoserine lactone efflux protein
MVVYYLLGFVLGALSSVIPGPCGLAIISAAARFGRQRAVATAVGSGLGDLFYATIGVLGIGRLVAGDRALVSVLLAISGLVLIGYGFACVRSRQVTCTRQTRPSGGLLVGFATLVCNPGALVTWSIVVGSQLAGATGHEQLCAALGIGCGSIAWARCA